MLQEVLLPKLGQTVEQATIENWRIKEGDSVRKGDVLLEITTDKATLEVESYVEGTVLKIYAQAGDEVPVEAVIAYVGDPATDKAPDAPPTALVIGGPDAGRRAGSHQSSVISHQSANGEHRDEAARPGRLIISPRAKKRADDEKVTPLAIRGTGPGGRIVEADVTAYAARVAALRVSPTAKELAWQRGVDLLAVKAAGPGGRIMKSDVESAKPAAVRAAPGRVEMTAARRIIAERMSQSKRTAPHFYLQIEIDMTEAVALREELKAAGTKVSFNDLIAKALAAAFAEVPMMNAAWTGDGIALLPSVDVSIAVALDGNLVVPVVRGVDRLSLVEIAEQSARLIEKARTKRLAPFEYEGGSITISNLGMYGVDNFLPIINPGQCSILGVGRIADKPVVGGGGIAVRKMMGVTLAIDHRVADGATAAAFLQTLKAALESPREGTLTPPSPSKGERAGRRDTPTPTLTPPSPSKGEGAEHSDSLN